MGLVEGREDKVNDALGLELNAQFIMVECRCLLVYHCQNSQDCLYCWVPVRYSTWQTVASWLG